MPPAPPSAADSSAAEVAAGPADHGADVPLNRQLAAGGAPSTRGSAWVWVLFAALGFLAGQVLAALFITAIAAVNGHLGSLTAITHLTEPPTWYVVSSLLGLWAGFFGGATVGGSVNATALNVSAGSRTRWSSFFAGVVVIVVVVAVVLIGGGVVLARRRGSSPKA